MINQKSQNSSQNFKLLFLHSDILQRTKSNLNVSKEMIKIDSLLPPPTLLDSCNIAPG